MRIEFHETWLPAIACALVAWGVVPACENAASESPSDIAVDRSSPRAELGRVSQGGPQPGPEGGDAGSGALAVAGSVRQPFSLTRSELRRFEAVEARLNDVRKSGDFRGVFELRGVPLRTLLEQARVVKESAAFGRELDLAIVARNRDGRRVVLSWGEVFYRNPAETVVAYEGAPRMPHKACSDCHEPSTYRPWLDQLEREVGFPKLVVTGDFYADRSLEDLVAIEVTDLGADVGIHVAKADRPQELFSGEIRIEGPGIEPATVRSLERYTRIEADAIQAGDGTGFHGVRRYSGVALSEVLEAAGVSADPSIGLVLSAPDGYRVFLAGAEVFDPARGGRLLLVDRMNGQPIERGRFQLVPLDDHAADRWLKAVARIDVVRARPRVSRSARARRARS